MATIAVPTSHAAVVGEESRPHKRLPLAAAVVGLVTSLWAGYSYAPTGDDSQDYTLLAQNVADGNGLSLSPHEPYQASAVRAPVYPLFLGLVYRTVGDSRESVLLVQALVLAFGCALLTKLALIVFDRRVAIATVVLFAANPYFGRWAGSLLTEPLYITLIIGSVYAFTRALRRSRAHWFALTGLLWAVATLCRPLTVALLPLMVLGVFSSPTVSRRARQALVLVIVGLLGLLPWTVRNWRAFDAFIPLQTQAFGSNFWLTTLPPEDQPVATWDGIQQKWQGKYPELNYAAAAGKDTIAQRAAEKVLIAAALQRIEANPAAYLVSRIKSWPHLWLHSGGLWYGSVSFQSALSSGRYGVVTVKLFLFLLLSLLPLVLGVLGIWLCRHDLRRVFPLLIVPLFIGVMHVPLWIEDRYGMPAGPFFLIFAGLTLTRLAPPARGQAGLLGPTLGTGPTGVRAVAPAVRTISVVIPTKNEGDVVVEIADAVRKFCDQVIIVDGHSTDGSAQLLRERGFTVLSDHKRGKGDGVRCGLEAATCDIVVLMDADGSHQPEDIPRLLAPLLRDEADMVIGCRMSGGSDEFSGTWELFIRLWGNNFLTMLLNMRYGVALTDTQNGFRAARRAMLQDLCLRENKHTIELEMVMKALKHGYRVTQVPSHEYRRRAGVSSLSVRKQAIPFLFCLLTRIW